MDLVNEQQTLFLIFGFLYRFRAVYILYITLKKNILRLTQALHIYISGYDNLVVYGSFVLSARTTKAKD